MQADRLDQRLDLRLGPAHHDRPPLRTESACEHREIDHQRWVGEHELREVDGHIRASTDRARQRLPPEPLGVPVLIAAAPKRRRLVIEVDDLANLPKPTAGWQHPLAIFDSRFRIRRLLARAAAGRAAPGVGRRASGHVKMPPMATVDEVTDVLRDVIDPELGLDFVELGLIYDVEIEDGTVRITYTLTSPGCPIGPQVSEQIEEFVGELDGVVDVQPTMTFSPPWTPDRMSEDAKFALGF